ncbi:MAG: glycosyltransferase [Candidatus Omnitrophica bacterium]|nr:glycosyltransferase [Candidatus Omnitrophota bacterium]
MAKKFHVPEEKIKVVYAACESNFKPAATADSVSIVRSRVSAGNPYLLHFSTGDSRDNTETVLAAFEQVRFEFPGLKLVIVGHPIDSNDVQIERSENDLVIRLPFVSDNELIELYQAAEAYVDPSLYEGFGFQPLEAMACGAPVVASDVTAVPEVVQDAGILVDPCNPRMLAEAISKLLHNPSLRDDLREKGLRRAASFNWNQTAQEVLAGFETVLKEAVCKVAVLTEIISPYRIPVFNEIAKDSRINLNVIFFAETSGDRKWKISKQDLQFKYLVSWGIGIPLNRRFPVFFNPMIFGKLLQINPDVIICGGYQHPSFLMAYFFAKLFRKQIILWSESHALSIRLKQWWAMFYRRAMVKQSSAYIVPGKLARNFLLDLGAHSDRIYAAPNAVDNDFFYSSSRSFCASKEQLKEERKWPRRLILYVGLLVDAKGIRTLLEAFSKLSGHEDIGLILVGDGPGEKHYRRYCKEKSLKSVFFEGFKQQDELPLYYGVSDFLVMPSFRDEWGLVINEAMAAGLPVIVSDRVGAAYDLVQHGVNGYQFPAGQEDELARYLDLLVKDDQLRKSMGERSLEMIKGFHPRQGAVGFIESSLHVFEQNLSKGRR